jgi:glycerophosphoryl diester phosphodiesterase
VIHDLTLNKTTNGTGLVRALDLKAIKELDAGSSFSAAFKGEPIPTLDEVFETLDPDMIVNVELKSDSWPPNGLEPAVLAVIRRHRSGSNPRVLISSFNPFALQRFRALAPNIPIGCLYAPEEPVYLRQRWFMIGCHYDAIHPKYTMLSPETVVRAHRRGWRVNTWTVDDPEQIRRLRGWGVDAIISNCPNVALKALGRTPER